MRRPLLISAWVMPLMMVMVLLISPVMSVQGRGNGIVIEGNPMGTEGIGSLNPLLCNNPYCRRITDFLFPTLYAVDPVTGLVVAASDDNHGLATTIEAPAGATSVVVLRDDLHWSDGQPVTAYDVFYSYLVATSRYLDTPYGNLRSFLTAARVIDEHSIEFGYEQANCATPARMNFPIIPAHVFDTQFPMMVRNAGHDGALEVWFAEWLKTYPPIRVQAVTTHPFNQSPMVSAGVFQFAERLPGEEIRLATSDGRLAFIYRDIPFAIDSTQNFRAGNSNVLVNPPLEQRDNLLADADVQVAQTPGAVWNYIAFNLADPNFPRSAYDGNGKALEQGHHPLFGDVRVRQAVQKAINVPLLIDTAVLGYGLPLASNRIPGTWGVNETLQPIGYDPEGAKQLLESAGWIDRNADGIRECIGCLYAEQGRELYFDMLVVVGDGREIAANLMMRQLNSVGFYMSPLEMDEFSLEDQIRFQEFDAYLAGEIQPNPTELDLSALFARSSDVLYNSGNVGSYANPQLDALMQQALTLPGCEAQARKEIDQQVQQILHDDLPYVWLYATQDMLVTRGIVGVDPYPYRPFWNIQDWITTS